jgi:hypothetical protein
VGLIFSKFASAALAIIFAAIPMISYAQSLSIQLAPAGNATLTWDAGLTGPVSVERSGNLTIWSVVSAENSSGTYTEAVGNATRAFYRLVPASMPMIFVQGGTVPASMYSPPRSVGNFSIAKTEISWSDWERVRSFAIGAGYDLGNVGENNGPDSPVTGVNWYDALKWCNAKSQMEGLSPVYRIADAIYKSGQQIPEVNTLANGYRLPTEAEWEWAALGGVLSNGYEFSGGNFTQAPNFVWYNENSGVPPSLQPIATKLPNELGIHDMSGNAFEWCWEIFNPTTGSRQIRGGSFASILDFCAVDIPAEAVPSDRNLPIGFRALRRQN